MIATIPPLYSELRPPTHPKQIKQGLQKVLDFDILWLYVRHDDIIISTGLSHCLLYNFKFVRETIIDKEIVPSFP